MTVQALCNAIRSQLFFSQVSSWVDLLKKAHGDISLRDQTQNLFSPEIMQNPRLRKNLETMQVDLDILFRIKPFDGGSCFNGKPNVHNFPDTVVDDKMALRVCLKSLPRLEKIPTLNTEKANINGFSCDNRIRSSLGSPVAGSSCHLLLDRLVSCHEKGKHRCKDLFEDECYVDEKAENQSPTAKSFTSAQEAPSVSSPSKPSTPKAHLSHRERQLLKYKKRVMKRDKQKKKGLDGDQASVSSLNTSGSEEFDKFDETEINETFAPLYGDKTVPTATSNLKTISIATQTDINDEATEMCNTCGESLQCWNCDKNQSNIRSQTTTSLCVNIGSVVGTMIGNKADLLLQAIQRTADAHPDGTCGVVCRDKAKDNIFSSTKSHHGDSSATPSTATDASRACDKVKDNNNYLIINNNDDGDKGEAQLEMDNDCRLCKRQKTRHNYTASTSVNITSSGGSYRRTMSECLVAMTPDDEEDEADGAMSYSPLPVHNCDDAEFNYASNSTAGEDAHAYGDLKAYRRAFSEDVINQLPSESCCFEPNEEEEFITLKCHHCKHDKTLMEPPAALKLTPNVTLQHVRSAASMSPHKKLLMNQKIPKINLSQVFDNLNPIDDSGIVQDASPTLSDNVFAFNTSPASSYPPTLMQLSPRIVGGSHSLLKRRSRHMSDRSSISEYSNFSDEDEEVLKAIVETTEPLKPPPVPSTSSSSKISSLYKKFVTKTHSAFNKLPLLATIEESLLRDRFQPKSIVSGFKLLLGASGSFCPTQLTIPAQTFFYEFQGIKHMSTPYVVS